VSQRAKGHLNRVRRLSIPRATFIDEVLAEHRLIIDAVSAHDADLAERELRQHLQLVPRELPRIRAEHPDFFEEP
jgi:DNA-binding GntR family transcriptional regulator